MSFNSPDISSISITKEELEKKIQDLQGKGLPGVKDVPKLLWDNMIEPKLLTQRQIAKKILLIKGQDFNPPLSEEDAQYIVYGKTFYQGGKLVDNDKKFPECVSKKGDADHHEPIDKNHPMWVEIENMFKGLKEKLIQLGIKLGEFILAIPAAIINITTSLVSLVSSAIILPFGAGIPSAISAVQTMLATLKELQAKTAALLPLIGVVDTIALILPKEAQGVIAQINVIYGILLGIITGISAILGLLDKVTSLLGKQKNKMDNQKFKAKAKSNPSQIDKGEEAELSAESTGGDWDFKYEWTDQYGTVISKEANVTVKPTSTTTYYCKITDGQGNIKKSETKIKVN